MTNDTFDIYADQYKLLCKERVKMDLPIDWIYLGAVMDMQGQTITSEHFFSRLEKPIPENLKGQIIKII